MPRPLWKGRPKAFPLHYDAWQFYPDHHAVELELDTIEEQGIASVTEALGKTPMRKPAYGHLYRKMKAQANDAICMFAFLDMLLQMQRGIYMRPSYIKDLLNQRWPQYVWSNSLIGRLAAGLARHVGAMYPECGERETPLARGRDGKGNYLVIDPKGGNEGLFWLVKARDIFLRESEALMNREAVNSVEVIEHSLWEFPKAQLVYAEYCSFRIRNEDNYRASWRPDTSFGPSNVPRPIKSPFGN